MGVVTYAKGAVIHLENRVYTLDHEMEPHKWLLRDMSTGFTEVMPLKTMQQKYSRGELVFRNGSTESTITAAMSTKRGFPAIVQPQIPDDKLEAAKIRRLYVQGIKGLPTTKPIIEVAVKKVWEKIRLPASAPHWSTVVRWKNRFTRGGEDIAAIVDQNGKKGTWNRYPEEVVSTVKTAIDMHYLSRPPKTIQQTLNHAIYAIRQENEERPSSMLLPEPTRRLVKRLIEQIPAFDRYAAQHGVIAARNKFRATLNRHVTEAPLERVEMDHTQLDIFVLRDKDFVPMGRPYVTTCLDTHTRCVLGIYIGFEPPSYLSVSRCLKHAILPKTDLNETYPDIQKAWNAHGIPLKLHLDNGREFHGNSIQNACYTMNITLEYSPPMEPWHKGMIERFQGTMNRAIAHPIPGTTFSNIFDKNDYDPVKHAILTLSQLRCSLHKWIADVYHQQPHRGLGGIPPAVAWDTCIDPQEIRIADDPRRLDVILGTSEKRQLTGKGISLHGLSYNSPELHDIFKRYAVDAKGIQVELRIDEGDLGNIHVIVPDKTGHVVKVPALDQAYADGTSLWMHNVFKRYAKEHALSFDTTGWLKASMEIAHIVQTSLKKRPGKSHAKAARYLEASKHKNAQPIGADTGITHSPDRIVHSTIMPAVHLAPEEGLQRRPNYQAIIEQQR